MWCKMNNNYTLYINGEAVPVTEEVYKAYYQERRREKTLIEKDIRNNVSTYGEPDIFESSEKSADDVMSEREERETLRAALAALTAEDYELISALFFENLTVAELSRRSGIPRKTLAWRRDRVLERMRKRFK